MLLKQYKERGHGVNNKSKETVKKQHENSKMVKTSCIVKLKTFFSDQKKLLERKTKEKKKKKKKLRAFANFHISILQMENLIGFRLFLVQFDTTNLWAFYPHVHLKKKDNKPMKTFGWSHRCKDKNAYTEKRNGPSSNFPSGLLSFLHCLINNTNPKRGYHYPPHATTCFPPPKNVFHYKACKQILPGAMPFPIRGWPSCVSQFSCTYWPSLS